MSSAKPTPPKATRRPAKAEAETPRAHSPRTPEVLPFTKDNYRYLFVGVGALVLGYLLLSLDGYVDATQFSVSLYIAPFVIVGGYAFLAWAIMFKRKSQQSEADPSA